VNPLRTLQFIWQHPLARRNKSRALSLWIRWQIGSRVLRQPVVMPFVEDAVLVVESGMTGATGNIYCGLHEFADMSLVLHLLRPEDLFLDAGANVGSYSILAAKVAGAKCVTVEPVPSTFARLYRNVTINQLHQQVELWGCALGSSSGVLQFSADRDTTNCAVDKSYQGKSISVPLRTVDEVLARKAPVMWKVDVEGFEQEVLRGAKHALQNEQLNVVLLESDGPELSTTMTASGFSRCNYDPFLRQLQQTGTNNRNQNHLWVRDMSAVEARCQSAPKRAVFGVEI